jgi:hypothetical protein
MGGRDGIVGIVGELHGDVGNAGFLDIITPI